MSACSPSRGPLAALAAALVAALLPGCTPDKPVHGSLTTALAVVDLDGDHRLDVVGANTAYAGQVIVPGFVSSRLQDPANPGRFLDPVRSDACLEPQAMVAGEVDGDATPPALVVACPDAQDAGFVVELLRQDPALPGAFLAPLDLVLGDRRPLDVRLGDVDGDGRVDVAVAADNGSSVQAFLQASDGTFGAPLPIDVGGEPVAVALADLTGAGRLDVVAALRGGHVAVALHDTDLGTFKAPMLLVAGSDLSAVAVADLDGDGIPDLLVTDFTSGTLYVMIGGGAGGFAAAVPHAVGNLGALAIAVGDLDGDGRPDVVVASYGPPGVPGSLSVFLQATTAGVLDAPALYVEDGPTGVVIGDVTGDGLPDLVAADGAPLVWAQDPAHHGKFLAPLALRQ